MTILKFKPVYKCLTCCKEPHIYTVKYVDRPVEDYEAVKEQLRDDAPEDTKYIVALFCNTCMSDEEKQVMQFDILHAVHENYGELDYNDAFHDALDYWNYENGA